MNQLGVYQPTEGSNEESGKIMVTVIVNLLKSNLNMQIHIDPDIPFYLFLEGIKNQIFAQRMPDMYSEKIECQLQNGVSIHQNEQRSLEMLGFSKVCTLYIRIFLRECRYCTGQQQGPKIKVQVEYEMPYDPNISMEEQTNRIKNAIHFDESKISNVSISSIKIDPQQY